MKGAGIAIGLLLVVVGVVLVFIPMKVAGVLHRPSSTPGELINLRATWGGGVMGAGAFIAALSHRGSLTPWGVSFATLLVCFMAGVGVARTVGFVLDGRPDRLQWFWLIAEVVLAAAGAIYLLRQRAAGGT